MLAKRPTSAYNVARGEVTELADVHDLGSCGATRAGSSPAFPMTRRPRPRSLNRGRWLLSLHENIRGVRFTICQRGRWQEWACNGTLIQTLQNDTPPHARSARSADFSGLARACGASARCKRAGNPRHRCIPIPRLAPTACDRSIRARRS